jgi:hypothetical protein
MSQLINLTAYDAVPLVTTGIDGRFEVTVVIKATYRWDERGQCAPIKPQPVTMKDEYAGDPAFSGLVRASDLSPPKANVDVLLSGAIVFPQPITEIDVHLSLGNRLSKRIRVFGDRFWLPAATADLAPSQPRPVSRVPIVWERSFGGADPADSKCIELRNPAGSGVAKDPKTLERKPAPNFEDPNNLLPARLSRPAPVGFGPVAPHWQPRVGLAGTYDESWNNNRRPLPPEDFSPHYFNLAPADQQVDAYQPGEELRLFTVPPVLAVRICLPVLQVPVTVVTADDVNDEVAVVDTIILEPEERRLSLLARACTELGEDPMSLGPIIVGETTAGMRKAIENGKAYPWQRVRQRP